MSDYPKVREWLYSVPDVQKTRFLNLLAMNITIGFRGEFLEEDDTHQLERLKEYNEIVHSLMGLQLALIDDRLNGSFTEIVSDIFLSERVDKVLQQSLQNCFTIAAKAVS